MEEEIVEIWIIHSERRILVTNLPGPPAAVCGFVSEEARAAAQARGVATVSEIGFAKDCYLKANGWEEANRLAQEKAVELGYKVKYEDRFFEAVDGGEPWDEDEEFYDWDPDPDNWEDEDE